MNKNEKFFNNISYNTVGTFFAVPYLGLSVGILPSLAIGACAFGAGELVFKTKNKETLKETDKNLYDILQDAKEKNRQIANTSEKIEDNNMKKNIKEITQTLTKIINTIEKKPEKASKMNTFFSYYLPRTLDILNKYDEIENQELSAEDSKKFMKQTQEMIEKINKAFSSQLSNLYQSDIVDTDAEMKVFDSMLKADGYDMTSDFGKNNISKNKEDGDEK